jgi:hypothetical protein
MLRFDHPGKFLNRVPREDVTVRDTVLRKGTLVLLGIGAAQRGDHVFQVRIASTSAATPARVSPRPQPALLSRRQPRAPRRPARPHGAPALASHPPADAAALRWRQSLVVRGMESFPLERVG